MRSSRLKLDELDVNTYLHFGPESAVLGLRREVKHNDSNVPLLELSTPSLCSSSCLELQFLTLPPFPHHMSLLSVSIP